MLMQGFVLIQMQTETKMKTKLKSAKKQYTKYVHSTSLAAYSIWHFEFHAHIPLKSLA